MKIIYILIMTLFCYSLAHAGITEKGRGMLFGDDHAFVVSAISGWVLDNQSGVRQGLHMIFYPVGGTWADGPVRIYGKAVSKTKAPTIKFQVRKTIEFFHRTGSPDYRVEKKYTLKGHNKSDIEIYYLAGDKWGNFEAVAYYNEQDTINLLVYNARSKEMFDKYISNFIDIAKTYKNRFLAVSCG